MTPSIRNWVLGIFAGLAFFPLLAGGPSRPRLIQRPALTIASRTPVPTVTGWPSHTPSATPTVTIAGTYTATPTPTSHPGPANLLTPDDGALMSQPVEPGEWYFAWNGRTGPCWSSITIKGPDSRLIQRSVSYTYTRPDYQFIYTTTAYLPDDALGPWTWQVAIGCPAGSSSGEIRTFFVQPASTPEPHRFFLVLIWKS